MAKTTCRRSKRTQSAQWGADTSDYPGYFKDSLKEKAKDTAELPEGSRCPKDWKGVYLRVNQRSTKTVLFYRFSDETAAQDAITYAWQNSS